MSATIARFIAASLLVEQSREAHRCTQLEPLRAHLSCERDRLAEVGLGQFHMPLFEPQFAA
jgi:hypothetical protein